MGRLSEKCFPDRMRTLWHYDGIGQLTELVHEDERGPLDRYRYEYDSMGNKTAIIKERRGLQAENGRYEYGYDALSRLVSVGKDGNPLRNYAYDAFGNRSSMENYRNGKHISYTYDTMNRLTVVEEGFLDAMVQGNAVHTDYSYDNRGNMIREEAGGRIIHGYEYGALNRLTRAWDGKGQEALYRYNGLGQRTGSTVNGREEDYLLDLTKPYHNLLGLSREGNKQDFYFDWNVAAMEEKRKGTRTSGRMAFPGLHYYMQDELGSPLRVSGFGAEAEGDLGRSSYLSYGYDEFGNDLGRELEESEILNPYDRQKVEQPFGYTGYRWDEISEAYFAQAREYESKNGRFTAEDVKKGNGAVAKVLNMYSYCWSNPLLWGDLNGLWPAWLEGIYAHIQCEMEFLIMYEQSIGLISSDNVYGDINVYIPGGGAKGGRGFADIVLYNGEEVEIYEIKPLSYYEDPDKKKEGEAQLMRYVNAYGEQKAIPGEMENVMLLLLFDQPFVFDENRTIQFSMYEDSPGMIYYELDDGNRERQEESFEVKVPQLESDEKVLIAWLLAGAAGVGGLSMSYIFGSGGAGIFNGFGPIIIIDEDVFKMMIRIPNGEPYLA